ncbi:MAG TPA: MBL fold metallo-hydrolase [Opitutaceae bacterium]|nr:MBL fold metallo-hydrolase [Opitutaceae bacterium]
MTPPVSDHFNGKTFFQPHHLAGGRHWDLLRWRLTAQPKRWPAAVSLERLPPRPAPRADEVVVTWIGHASILLETMRGNFLVDPVFSERASPFAWIGPRRVHPPGVAFDALPRIDAVLLSHDHYDHFDVAALRRLAREHRPHFIAPLRHRDLLAPFAPGADAIVELDWWQSHPLGRAGAVTLTPTKHWSNRFGTPRNHRLWGGFYFTLGSRRIWFVGDTGFDEALFRDVRARCGAPDLALVPIGAYEPRWFMAPMHMDPAEAVQLHRLVGARRSIGMHWGTFQLSDEGRDDPVLALAAARENAGLAAADFAALPPGGSVVV